MAIEVGTKVRHRKDPALGVGEVAFVATEAGVTKYFTRWSTNPNAMVGQTEAELEPIQDLPTRLSSGQVGEATFRPFVLRLLGRWFETRHALTGELSNQPFQMLPHQVIVTNRVVNSAAEGRRWLIADDVGLGKTIEAGMIMEVLRKRTLGRFRCLIVTPAGLKRQWKEEMERRFSRHFRLFDARYPNELEESDALIASIDTLRNKKKFALPIQSATPWDIVIFDEAHHLATETRVQRYDFARRLHEEGKARNTLFLTATPHSGNVEHFYNMLRLLRSDLFKTKEDVTRGDGRLNQLMIRNRKSEVTDAEGSLIFKGIQPAQILQCVPSKAEVAFYEELLAFVRQGYGVANTLKREKKDTTTGNAVGFLMATFRKLASSSRGAIETALHNRLRALEEAELVDGDGSEDDDERYAGEHEESQVTKVALEKPRGKAKPKSPIQNEIASIRKLLALLERIEHPDTKVTFFIEKLRELPNGEKGLIFTEYRGTQRMLVQAIQDAFGEDSVGVIHGSMKLDDRQKQVARFNDEPVPRFLVSTEAGGEGLNMQRSCHVVFNYDLPWNPNRLQQRIGRVYRYGQSRKVQVYNIRLSSDSEAFADARVDEYLRQKIDEITRRLAEVQDGKPEDVQNDVLGQVAQSMSLEELYEQAVTEGEERARRTIDQKSAQLEQILSDPEGMLGLFKGLRCFDITDYQKAAARVPDEALSFFTRQYLTREGEAVQEDPRGLLSFRIPQRLREVSGRVQKTDPNEARHDITEKRVSRVTVNKALARETPGSRLLRFGDPVFDAMVRHVQDSDFSEGVASIEAPARALGWEPGQRGVVVVFDIRVLRTEGSAGNSRVLREELYSLAIPTGGNPVPAERLLEELHTLDPGGLDIDASEVARAYSLARAAADRRANALHESSVADYGTSDGIVPEIIDYAIAWAAAHS